MSQLVSPLYFEASSSAQLESVAIQLLDYAGQRRLFTLEGELGAGKTTLVQAVCRHLGVREQATSPTFSIVNEYPFKDAAGQGRSVFHLDLYRLKSLAEALDIGIEEILDRADYCFIEWADVIAPLLSDEAVKISITVRDDFSREIVIS